MRNRLLAAFIFEPPINPSSEAPPFVSVRVPFARQQGRGGEEDQRRQEGEEEQEEGAGAGKQRGMRGEERECVDGN